MTINQLFSCELTDVRCRRGAPWGRSDRGLPRPRQPSSAAIFCPPKPGGIAGSGSLSHRRLEGHRGIQVLLTYPWVLEVAKVVDGFSWICSVVSEFHPFICFAAGSGDWNPSGVPTQQQQDNVHWARGFLKLLIGWGIVSPFSLTASRKAQVWVCLVFLLWDANCLKMGRRRTIL